MGVLVEMRDCPYCGSGHNTPCFAVYEDGYKCFSCGKGRTHGVRHFAYNKTPVTICDKIKIPPHTKKPSDFGFDALSYLYKHHVNEKLIRKYNIMYVKPFKSFNESLIFPVANDDNKIVYYQRRSFPDKRILTYGDTNEIFVTDTDSSTIVLCEDFLSTIRVGEHTKAMCLFGTKIKRKQLDYITNNFSNIVLWLDGDEAGQEAAKKIERIVKNRLNRLIKYKPFAMLKIPTIRNIVTEQDPKCYTDEEIKGILNEENT